MGSQGLSAIIKTKGVIGTVVKTQTNVYETHYHFVFVTKYRQDIFTSKEKQEAMKGIMQKVADGQDFVIENMEVAAAV